MKRIAIVFLAVALFAITGSVNAQIALNEEYQKQMVMTNLSSMPLTFTENQGQFGEMTLFMANVGGATFYFCKDEVAYLFVRDTDELLEDDFGSVPDIPGKINMPRYKKESLLIKAQIVGANPNPEVIGVDRLPHNNNYFYSNDRSKWHTDVANYSVIVYKDIYPGIDLKYYGDGKSMKYDFIVNPGADISQIQIRYDGVDALSITPAGDLQAQTRFGLIHEKVPYVYQEVSGVQTEVTGYYDLKESGVFGFAVGESYNSDYPLIIDPELAYSTFSGGHGRDYGYNIAVDGSGSAYVTGQTISRDFPTVNPYDGDFNKKGEVFVTKLTPAGNSLTYSTYLGGSNWDLGYDIAVDGSGSAYVTGWTASSDFPTANPYNGSMSGMRDAFVTKLSPAGNSLIYSTYLGGVNEDRAGDIAVDGAGNAYVTGGTWSSDFPTVSPYSGSISGIIDAFITKFSPAGNSLIYSTYLGGAGDDECGDIALDGAGSAYLIGVTTSSDFPTVNPYDGSFNGDHDVFVTKLSPAGNSLTYSTYLGGSAYELGYSIAIDVSGSAYMAGYTTSSDFPTVNPYDGNLGGRADAFVAKLSPAGNSLTYSTYLGGVETEYGIDNAVDGSGSAYVIGQTTSSDFPTVNPYDGSLGGRADAFVTKFSPAGNSLTYSTYLGGRRMEVGYSIAVDGSGDAYVTGETRSKDFPMVNPFDDKYNKDAFVAKLTEGGALSLSTEIIAKVIEKVPVAVTPNVPDQNVILQGGDNISSATVIDFIPYVDNGTTSGYIDDYDEVCPDYSSPSTSPDVVYSYTPIADTVVDINLGGSSYDTKLFVYENDVTPGYPFACNDDYNDLTSALFYLQLSANNTYYFVIDGYDGGYGNYAMAFTASGPRVPYQPVHTPSDPWSAANSDAGSSSHYLVYDEFGGGGRMAEIRAYGIMLSNMNSCTEDPANFEVAFYEDSLGQPGIQVESFVVQAIQTPTGDWYGDYPLIEFKITFPYNLVMASGWLSVQGVSSPYTCQFYWMSGTGGDLHSLQWRGTSLYEIEYDRAWGLEIISSIDEVELLPTELDILTSYPNPFNSSTNIYYNLPKDCHVNIKVYDLLGRCVDVVIDETQQAGYHQVIWNSKGVSSGILFYKMQAGDFCETRKMLLLK